MELRHLRHFIAVAEELHFARAAERLGMEQSPLSHSIRNLEAELGLPLLHRTTRRTQLTRAGVRFYAEAVRILEATEAAKAAVRNQDRNVPERIVVGLAESAAGEPFTRFLFELEHHAPPLTIDLREISPGEGSRQLEERVLDLAIVLTPPTGSTDLRQVRGWAEPLVLIVPMGHPLAERDKASIQDLAADRLILPSMSASPGYAAQIEALLDRNEVRPPKRLTAKHQNTMVSFVATGRGLGLLPESIAHGLTTVAVLALVEPDAEMISWLLYRGEDETSELVLLALEVASLIDAGDDLPSDAERERAGVG